MFIAELFTIAKSWKQPKYPSVNEWVKTKQNKTKQNKTKLVYLHNGISCSREKEGTPILCDSMDGTGGYYAKWIKPGGERQMSYDLTYKGNLINKTNRQAK